MELAVVSILLRSIGSTLNSRARICQYVNGIHVKEENNRGHGKSAENVILDGEQT